MRARKRFGQNFLQDPLIIGDIVGLVPIKDGLHILEIGPGQGALTTELCRIDPSMTVVELDRDLIRGLEALLPRTATILQQDALQLRLDDLPTPLTVVGNLPYNISTPLLMHLLDQLDHIDQMIFMFQKEVVDRLSAQTHTKAYGRLSVVTQLKCQVAHALSVPPSAFWPAPKVDSAVTVLTPIPYEQRAPFHAEGLHLILTAAFGQRRKTLRNSLKHLFSEIALLTAGVDPAARAETLDPLTYAQLSILLSETGPLEPRT